MPRSSLTRALASGLSSLLVAFVFGPMAPNARRAAAATGAPQASALSGDFNGDGYGDLVAGVRFEDVGSVADAGVVNVIYGAGSGLAAPGNQIWSQDSTGITGQSERNDQFGEAVAVGDFNGDGFGDLAVGAPLEDFGSVTDGGSVTVIYGSASGLAATGSQVWDLNSPGVPGKAGSGDEFGLSVATGDFNGDRYVDLAVGAPGNDVGGTSNAGSVSIIDGSAAGLVSDGSQFWDQDSSGITGTVAHNDFFGWSLATADLGNGPQQDLAVGSPFDDPGGVADAGSVNVIYGSAAGLSSAGNQLWSQDSSGIADVAQVGDYFGWDVAAADFNGEGTADLAAGVPFEDLSTLVDPGAVNVIYGTATGLSSTGNQLWTQADAGSVQQAGANFGNALAGADFGNGSQADLAVGASATAAGTVKGAGEVDVLYGTAGGLAGIGAQAWNQDTGVILDQAETNDFLGADVAAADFNGDGRADLVAAVTFEDVGTVSNAGAANVIYGSAGGLADAGNQLWYQGTNGILDAAEPGDQFAYAVA